MNDLTGLVVWPTAPTNSCGAREIERNARALRHSHQRLDQTLSRHGRCCASGANGVRLNLAGAVLCAILCITYPALHLSNTGHAYRACGTSCCDVFHICFTRPFFWLSALVRPVLATHAGPLSGAPGEILRHRLSWNAWCAISLPDCHTTSAFCSPTSFYAS